MSISIERVKRGAAPDTADRVFIDLDRGGFYGWKGVVMVGGSPVYGGSPPEFRNAYEAEVDAVTWAMGHGISKLTIETDQGGLNSDQ